MKTLLFILIPMLSVGQLEGFTILRQLVDNPISESIEKYSDSEHSFEEYSDGQEDIFLIKTQPDSIHMFAHEKYVFSYEPRTLVATYQVFYNKSEFIKTRKFMNKSFNRVDRLKIEDGFQLSYREDGKFWSLLHYSDDVGEWMMIVCMNIDNQDE